MIIDPVSIMAGVLRSVIMGSSIREIRYPSSLSHASLHRYVWLLRHDRLIRYDGSKGVYVITDKGKRYLQECYKIKRCICQ